MEKTQRNITCLPNNVEERILFSIIRGIRNIRVYAYAYVILNVITRQTGHRLLTPFRPYAKRGYGRLTQRQDYVHNSRRQMCLVVIRSIYIPIHNID